MDEQLLISAPALYPEQAARRIPREPGMYAFWVKDGTLPAEFQGVRHPSHTDYRLLYVGISPARDTSTMMLSRRLHQHLRGSVEASTLRRSLASLLREQLGFTATRTPSGRVKLADGQERQLTEWMRTHLLLGWNEVPRPWEIEGTIIRALDPPLNLALSAASPGRDTLKAARAALISA